MKTGNAWFATYAYDANGNRLTMTQNGVTTAYTYDANNRLTAETVAGVAKTYTYDANGNLINAWNAGNPVGAYSYNLFGNQISFTADSIVYTNYTYRPDGLRHSIGGKVHIWDGANIIADVDDGDIIVYVRGINLIYADDGDRIYYHFNAHGDVVVLTNESGSKTKSYSYNAFGVEHNESTLDDNPFRYCGEYYDKETKTIYLRARYYNAEQGRFTQEDPIRDGYNWYAYCNGSPIMFVDPSGQKPADFLMGLLLSYDDNQFGGLVCKLIDTFTDIPTTYIPEDESDYYAGRVVGDGISLAVSIMEISAGIQMIGNALSSSGATIVLSNGSLVVPGAVVAVAGTVAGAATVAYGATTATVAVSNFSSDLDDLTQTSTERKTGVPKQESPIWNELDNVKGKSYKSSGEKKHRKYYEWDHLHDEIEVYDRHGKHLGAMDSVTGEMIKPPKKGRSVDIK